MMICTHTHRTSHMQRSDKFLIDLDETGEPMKTKLCSLLLLLLFDLVICAESKWKTVHSTDHNLIARINWLAAQASERNCVYTHTFYRYDLCFVYVINLDYFLLSIFHLAVWFECFIIRLLLFTYISIISENISNNFHLVEHALMLLLLLLLIAPQYYYYWISV